MLYAEKYSEPSQKFKMEHFAKIFYGLLKPWKRVNYFCKDLHLRLLTGFLNTPLTFIETATATFNDNDFHLNDHYNARRNENDENNNNNNDNNNNNNNDNNNNNKKTLCVVTITMICSNLVSL